MRINLVEVQLTKSLLGESIFHRVNCKKDVFVDKMPFYRGNKIESHL